MAKTKRVVFSFKTPGPCRDVKLCGSFTDWEEGAIIMTPSKTGEWKTQVSLEPGEYEYKFWADGVWHNDPQADRQVQNQWGSENSLRVVR